jgi:electron transfer flavoprotein beta subunit
MKPIHDPIVTLTAEEVGGAEFGIKEEHIVFGPYDENALETALQAKDRWGLEVTVLVVAQEVPEDLLRTVLAVGADRVVVVPTSSWQLGLRQLGAVLHEALGKVEKPVMVLAGIQSGDWDTGIVPPILAAEWQAPFVVNLVSIDRDDEGWILTSRDGGLTRRFAVSGKFVASVTSSGKNTLRYPTMRDRLQAKRKPISLLNDISVNKERSVALRWVPIEARAIEWIDGDNDAEKGQRLARRLLDRGWISKGGHSA